MLGCECYIPQTKQHESKGWMLLCLGSITNLLEDVTPSNPMPPPPLSFYLDLVAKQHPTNYSNIKLTCRCKALVPLQDECMSCSVVQQTDRQTDTAVPLCWTATHQHCFATLYFPLPFQDLTWMHVHASLYYTSIYTVYSTIVLLCLAVSCKTTSGSSRGHSVHSWYNVTGSQLPLELYNVWPLLQYPPTSKWNIRCTLNHFAKTLPT